MSNIFTLNWKNVLGAVVSAVLVAILGYLSVNYANIAWFTAHPILSAGALAGIASLLKAFTTNSQGQFAGLVPVK